MSVTLVPVGTTHPEMPGAVAPWIQIGLVAGLLGLVVAPASRSADYWVSPEGRDEAGHGGHRQPWATLQYAADRVRGWDTVHVLDGQYDGFYLARRETQDGPIQFRAEGGHVRIIKRNPKTPDGINIEAVDRVILEGFLIDEMPRAGVRITHSARSTIRRIVADRNRSWGIFTSFCDDIVIEDNTVSRSAKEHGIYVSNTCVRPVVRGNISRANRQCGIHLNGDASQGGNGIISAALIEKNIISDNGGGGGSGINCDGVRDSKIQNNLLYDNHSNGISLYRIDGAGGSTGNQVVNNTVVQARGARWAVNIKNRSTQNVIANNILLNRGPAGSINIASDSLGGLRSDHNIVVDRFSPNDGGRSLRLTAWRSEFGLDIHSLVADSGDLFIDPKSGDFHLRDGSPAIDLSDPSLAPPVDLRGSSRPAGPRPDAGAYEAKPGFRAGIGSGQSSGWRQAGVGILLLAIPLVIARLGAGCRVRDHLGLRRLRSALDR